MQIQAAYHSYEAMLNGQPCEGVLLWRTFTLCTSNPPYSLHCQLEQHKSQGTAAVHTHAVESPTGPQPNHHNDGILPLAQALQGRHHCTSSPACSRAHAAVVELTNPATLEQSAGKATVASLHSILLHMLQAGARNVRVLYIVSQFIQGMHLSSVLLACLPGCMMVHWLQHQCCLHSKALSCRAVAHTLIPAQGCPQQCATIGADVINLPACTTGCTTKHS